MDVVLVTATWRQDLDRFRLLRRSLREFGLDESFHHIVAVHTEDVELLADLRGDRNLEIVPTARLLTRQIERRRAAAHFRRTSPRHWVRAGIVPGWYAQQLTKLATVGLAAGAQAVVVLDSDLIAIRPFGREDFITSGGATKFFVNSDMRDDGTVDWNRTAARLLGVNADLGVSRQFIHAPAVLDVRVASLMLDSLSRPGDQAGWQAKMLAANAFEYPTYGLWVSHHDPANIAESAPMDTVNFNIYPQMWDFAARARQAIDDGKATFLSVQSRLHIPPESYESIVSRAWRH